MLVYELWEEYKKYTNYTPFLSDEPSLSLGGYAGELTFGWRGGKTAIYKRQYGDRSSDYFDMIKYTHEGSAVYEALDEARRHLRDPEGKKWFEDFSILTKPNDCGYGVKYGAVIKIDGQFRVYLADAHTFTLGKNDFLSADSAAAYFEKVAENDPMIQEIISKFIADYHGVQSFL
ncbi:MAG: hypothetical protein E7296_07895 [Lachnospiraceae bacterium]|jgi:hypothetical protein|nr:hypothetical protein [Lachnospiraceae bacterium]